MLDETRAKKRIKKCWREDYNGLTDEHVRGERVVIESEVAWLVVDVIAFLGVFSTNTELFLW